MCALVIAALCFSAQAQAPVDIRVALVIGNSAYAGAPLINPANDARAMGDSLRGLGFTVVELRDAQREQMTEAIAKVRDALKGKQGVGMLYYAGHGLQLDWHNYMVPVDAKLSKAADVAGQTIDDNSVIDAFKSAGNRMNILVLDACRDNPFVGTASGKGLAQLDAPPGTFLAYATAPGNVAEDGDAKGGNGLYTSYLLQELKKPQAKIEDMFKRVRLNVRKASAGRQVPWEATSLEDDFYFASGKLVLPANDPSQREQVFSAEKMEWDRIKDSRNPDDFFAFLQRHPTGFISEQAQFRLDQLAKVAVTAQPGRDGITALPSGAVRYPVGTVLVYSVQDGNGKFFPQRRLVVTELRDGKVFINGGKEVWDEMGNLIANEGGIRSPAKGLFPAELAVGKQWHNAYEITGRDNSILSVYWDFRVIALENISVPAGTFKAYRIDGTSRSSGGQSAMQTYWVDPERMLIVRDKFIRRDPSNQIDLSYVFELFSARRG